MLSEDELQKALDLAQKERSIIDAFHKADCGKCLANIEKCEADLDKYSQGILGLYLSIGVICALRLGDTERAERLSQRAIGINKVFGLYKRDSVAPTVQVQNILAGNTKFANLIKNIKPDWVEKTPPVFEQDLKSLGTCLGFDSERPEKQRNGELGTLDNLWLDEKNQIAIGFEVKNNKKMGA